MNEDVTTFTYTDDTLDEAVEVSDTGLYRSPTRLPLDRFDISEAFETLTIFLGISLPAAIRFNELVHNCYLCVPMGKIWKDLRKCHQHINNDTGKVYGSRPRATVSNID